MVAPSNRPAEVEPAFLTSAQTGECPIWSDQEMALYWIDVEQPAIHCLKPEMGLDEIWEMPCAIGGVALCRSGAMLAALRTGLARVDLRRGDYAQICAPPYNPLLHRFNETKCDARGRFWVGTKHEPLRAPSGGAASDSAPKPVHVLECGGALTQRPATAVIANGLAWSPDSRTMYFADSGKGTIWAFDFDLDGAALSEQRVFAQFRTEDGAPDGATVDAEGFYWCALYGGGRIVRLAPDGRIDRDIRLPVSQPTMCAFGDADYGTLYITTAAHGVAIENEPFAGAVFRCRPGVRGLPAALFADM
jgi:sugar lactone lactonase YvrE